MPYRRLPKTDQARLKALRVALVRLENQGFGDAVVSFVTVSEAKNFLDLFEGHLFRYRETVKNQVAANRSYQKIVANVRLYLSHFIQVLNLAVVRGEIKKEKKLMYGLDLDSHIVPDLSSEAVLLRWGERIIRGENERIQAGGVQIYNPTITKVKVYYEIFKEHYTTQKTHKSTVVRNRLEIVKLRKKCDELILSIWNQVEDKFKSDPLPLRIKNCQEYGLIYYYRKGEKKAE